MPPLRTLLTTRPFLALASIFLCFSPDAAALNAEDLHMDDARNGIAHDGCTQEQLAHACYESECATRGDSGGSGGDRGQRNPCQTCALEGVSCDLCEGPLSSVAIIHTTQLPLLFISGLGFGPRFRASVSALATSSTPWCVLPELHNCTQLCKLQQFELRSFKFKLLFIANATRSRSTFGGNHGGVPHGPRPETEARNDRIVAKIRTPFRASERAPFPTPRIFATLCQISGLGANSF